MSMPNNTERNKEITEETIQSVLNEINQYESIDYYISTLSPEEIHFKIDLYKKISQKQLMELGNLVESIDQKVSKINPSQNILHAGNALSSSSVPKVEDISCIRKKHQNRLQELQREFDNKLKESIDKIEDEHNETINNIFKKHEAKINQLYQDMEKNQNLLDQYNDPTKYITIKKHNDSLEKIKVKYDNEIQGYDENIKKLEAKIMENYSQWINKSNCSIKMPNVKNLRNRNLSLEIEEFITKLKNCNGNDNIISIVSNMPLINEENCDMMDDVNVIGNIEDGINENEDDERGIVIDNENMDTIHNEEYYEREEDHDVAEFSDNEQFNPKNIALYSEITRFKKDNSN